MINDNQLPRKRKVPRNKCYACGHFYSEGNIPILFFEYTLCIICNREIYKKGFLYLGKCMSRNKKNNYKILLLDGNLMLVDECTLYNKYNIKEI